jgi:hypothetical protein
MNGEQTNKHNINYLATLLVLAAFKCGVEAVRGLPSRIVERISADVTASTHGTCECNSAKTRLHSLA